MNELKKMNNKIHEITQVGKYAHEAMMFARIVIGCVFIYHALTKLGGQGSIFMTIVGLVELASAVFILLGTKIRLAGSVLGVVILGAIFSKIFVWNAGFSGVGGWEFDIVIIALLFVLVSVDSTKYRLPSKK
ncbi:MAG: DoxX family protein [bacterium]